MNRPRRGLPRPLRTIMLAGVLLLAPATFAHAQIGPFPAGLGYPMYGYGYGGMAYGYGFPAYGGAYAAPGGFGYGYPNYAYPAAGLGYGYSGITPGYAPGYAGVQQYFYPSQGYANPLFGQGLSPLGVQSALSENALIRGSRSVGRTAIPMIPNAQTAPIAPNTLVPRTTIPKQKP